MLKQKLLFAVALLVAVSMGCKKEDSVDPDKKNTENPITDTTSTDTTDNDGGNNGGNNITKLNAPNINGEEIKVNSVTYGSASVFVNLASNNQDLASISIWFPLVNTGNGIQVPELGTYNVIENQTGGTPQSANQSTIHLRFISDPSYSYLYSTAGGTVEVVNDSESYRNFIVSNVNFERKVIINLFPNSGPKGEVTLNATFSLNPFIGIERNATEATLGTWNLNGKIFTVDSEIPKPAHPSISAAGVSYISNIGRTDLRVGEVNSNISFTVQFKPNIAVVADGTYPVVNKPLGGINEA